jgi:hypothetical protein
LFSPIRAMSLAVFRLSIRQPGLFDIDERLKDLSAKGNDLERRNAIVDFEMFRQQDRDARWTVKFTTAKPADNGAKRIDIAIPVFGYKNHIGIDRAYGLIRTWKATDAACHDGRNCRINSKAPSHAIRPMSTRNDKLRPKQEKTGKTMLARSHIRRNHQSVS